MFLRARSYESTNSGTSDCADECLGLSDAETVETSPRLTISLERPLGTRKSPVFEPCRFERKMKLYVRAGG